MSHSGVQQRACDGPSYMLIIPPALHLVASPLLPILSLTKPQCAVQQKWHYKKMQTANDAHYCIITLLASVSYDSKHSCLFVCGEKNNGERRWRKDVSVSFSLKPDNLKRLTRWDLLRCDCTISSFWLTFNRGFPPTRIKATHERKKQGGGKHTRTTLMKFILRKKNNSNVIKTRSHAIIGLTRQIIGSDIQHFDSWHFVFLIIGISVFLSGVR